MRLGFSDTEELNLSLPGSSSEIRRFGDYELLEEVGRGGMGVVYRARQISLNRIVAVKMLVARPFAVPELEKRLHLEAEAAAGLNHPNIVTVYDFGECDDQFFFSMEFIEGRSLAQVTRHHSLAPIQAAQYVKAVAEAVHHAHEHGILHRDLKPSNILIDLHDQVKVTDFGLAKRLGTDSELTLTGQLVGSPNYLSPEQAAGNHQALTVRSDVYSLGAVLYQLLTARPPLVGESLQETLAQIREKKVPSPRLLSARVPGDLETICLKCLEKEPGQRYESARALAADLGRFLEGKPILARPISAAGRVWRWCRRKPALAGALAGCALTLLVGVIGIAWQWKRAEAEARAAERSLYGADMLLAQQALEQSDLGRAKGLLDRHRPAGKSEVRSPKSAGDLRGWEWRYLWSQCQSDEQFTLFRGLQAVTALAFSADGSRLAVRRDPDTVMLWDVAAQRLISEQPASPWFKALAAAPSGQLLAWGTRASNGTPSVLLWDAALQCEVARLPHTNEVVTLAFSPDAQWLAMLMRNAEVLVWNVGAQQVAARFQTHTNLLLEEGSHYGAVLFSPSGRTLAVGTKESRGLPGLHLVEWGSGEITHVSLPAPADGVTAMAFTPDGKWLAVAGGYSDRLIHLYELASGRWSHLEGKNGWIVCLAFSPDGQMLALASADQSLRLWDWQRGAELRRFQGHESDVYFVAWTPDGCRLVSGSKDGSVRFWDPAATPHGLGHVVLPERNLDLAFAPDSKRLVTPSWDEPSLIVRDARSLQPLEKISLPGYAQRLALTEDGRRAALGFWGGHVGVWDLEARRMITNFVVGARAIVHLQFSRDGNRLLCLGEDAEARRVIEFYNTASWDALGLQAIRRDELYTAVLSPSGGTLAVAHRDGMVRWWDLKTEKLQALFQWEHLAPVIEMAFSQDGRWFAAGGERSVLMLLEVASQRATQVTHVHHRIINSLAFSPNGRRLITSGTSGNDTLKFWDVEGARDIAMLGSKGGFFDHVGFSPDGNTVFAVDNQGTVLLWQAPSFEEIAAQEQARARRP